MNQGMSMLPSSYQDAPLIGKQRMGPDGETNMFGVDAHTKQTAQLIGMMGLAWALLELLSYVVIRPYFVHLLEGNPQLAGKREKQEKTATQMCPRVVCFVHNALQVPLALMILLDPVFNRNTIWAANDFSTLVMAISAGYFIYDTFECMYRLEHEGWDFLLHGLFCCLVFCNLTYTGYMHFYGAGYLLWELSTPFMHLRWVLYKIGKDKTALYKYNALAGMLIFFLCRVVWGNGLSLWFWVDSFRALKTPQGAELSMPSIWFYRLCTVVLNGLNAWWFSKMVQLLLAAVRSPGGAAAKKAQ